MDQIAAGIQLEDGEIHADAISYTAVSYTHLDVYKRQVIVSVGGQIPNNLAMQLCRQSVPVLGTSPISIDRAENRNKFSAMLDQLGIDQPDVYKRQMLHTAMEKGNDVKEEVQNILALTLARAAAIVYGQVLSNEEMVSLVDSLFACPSPNYTPDGKTVLTTIKEEDIERLFK